MLKLSDESALTYLWTPCFYRFSSVIHLIEKEMKK